MSEFQVPVPQMLPEVRHDRSFEMAKLLRQIHRPAADTIPGFVVRGEGIYDLRSAPRAQTVGYLVTRALRELNIYSEDRVEEGILPTIMSFDHLDGIDYGGPFVQVLSNGPFPRAAFNIKVRRLSPFAQMNLAEQVLQIPRAREHTTTTFISSLHESVSEAAPIVYEGLAYLDEGDSAVFRNGHHASQVRHDEDVFLTSHTVWSVDENGNFINEARTPSVDKIHLPFRRVKR